MNHDIIIETVYPSPLATVWGAIADSASLAEWLMPNDFAPRLGHKFTFKTQPRAGFDGIIHCEVTRLEPPHVLSFSWVGGPLVTQVTFLLQETTGGTQVTFKHTGFSGPEGAAISQMLGSGWRGKILTAQLPELIARRTVGK